MLSPRGACTIFQGVGTRLDLLETVQIQQASQFIGQAIAHGGKEVPGLLEGGLVQVPVARERRTAALRLEFVFREPDHGKRTPASEQQSGVLALLALVPDRLPAGRAPLYPHGQWPDQ